MKKLFALILAMVMLLTGCGVSPVPQAEETSSPQTAEEISEETADEMADVIKVDPIVSTELSYTGLNDDVLLRQVEDLVYTETVNSFGSDEYVVEGVHAVFVSKEYIDEVMFNSQPNVYFGYTLAELDDLFQGTRYVFTLGDDGQTTVKEFAAFDDTATKDMIKNVAIGAGVILVCVTGSCVTAGSAPAVAMIFAVGAKSAEIMAISSGAIGAVTSGIVRGIQTGDVNEALKAAAMSGSEGFKWGAISGAFIGGGTETFLLKAGTKGGLTMNEVAAIQADSLLPMDVISEMHSLDEYLVYREAGLKPLMVNGKTMLVQNIDLNYVSELADGTKVTNLTRMQRGLAPLDPATGKAYQLHHIGQKADATLAILTEEQHQGNAAILNIFGKESEIIRNEFAAVRKETWAYLGNWFAAGGTL